jgi:hypothetical protein
MLPIQVSGHHLLPRVSGPFHLTLLLGSSAVLDSPSVRSLGEWKDEKTKFRDQLMELQTYIEDHDGEYPRQHTTCPIENKLATFVRSLRQAHNRNTMKSWKKNALDAAGFVWSVGTGGHAKASDAIRLKEHLDREAEIKSHGVTFTKRCRDCSKETQLLISQGYYKSKKAKGKRIEKRTLRCCSKEKNKKNGMQKENRRWDFVGTKAEFNRMEDILLGRL